MLCSADPQAFFEKFFELIEADKFKIKMFQNTKGNFNSMILEPGKVSVHGIGDPEKVYLAITLNFNDNEVDFKIPVALDSMLTERRIQINSYCMEKQQKKKADGGGFHEVEVRRPCLILENVRIMKEDAEARRLRLEASEQASREKKKRQEEGRVERKRLFYERLKSDFYGLTLKNIEVDEMGLAVTLIFDNNMKLNINVGGELDGVFLGINGMFFPDN